MDAQDTSMTGTNDPANPDSIAKAPESPPVQTDPAVSGTPAFWRKNFASRPYFTAGTSYEQFGSAQQHGTEGPIA